MEWNMKSGIYRILNLANNMCYVGSAVRISYRWKNHRIELRLDRHTNRYLQSAWNKYGEDNFEFEILEHCENNRLIELEQFWMDYYQSANREFGYNLSPTAGNCMGVEHTDETKAKLSELKIGKSIHTDESKAKIGIALKGRVFSEDTLRKMSESHIGHKHPEEFKDNMSKRLKGNNHAAGKKRSPEHLAAMLEGRRKKKLEREKW